MVLAIPDLRDAFEAAIHGDTAEVRSQIKALGVGRAAADPRPAADPLGRLLPGRDRRRGGRLRLRLLPGAGADDARLAALRPALLRRRPLGGAAAARPLVRDGALRAHRGDDRARRRDPAARRPPDPDRPLQPRLLRGGRRPRPALALRLDDRRRLPADHRPRRLLRHPPGRPQPHRPPRPRHRRCPTGAALHRPLGDAPGSSAPPAAPTRADARRGSGRRPACCRSPQRSSGP